MTNPKPTAAVYRAHELPREAAIADACRNCGAHAPGHYCGNCGQETRVQLPTFTAFMREAAGRYVSMDGRFWRTMASLVARPGFLTLEYLRGRRKRYIRPARLFLVLYLLLFGAVGIVQPPTSLSDEVVFVDSDKAGAAQGPPDATRQDIADARRDVTQEIARARREADALTGKVPAGEGSAGKPAAGEGSRGKAAAGEGSAPDQPASSATDANDNDGEAMAIVSSGNGATFFGLDKDLNLTLRIGNEDVYMPPQVRKRWQQFKKLSHEEKAERIYVGMLRYGPYAMVVLLPAFALLLKLVYLERGRRYPHRPQRYAEHLVCSAHLHAFAAVMLLALLLIPFGIVRVAIAAWVVYYAMRARQVVYGGRWWAGLLRTFAVGIAYLVLLAVAMAGLVVVAVTLR